MEPVKLAIFDFDGTLIKGDSIVAYLKLARRLKALSPGRFAGILLRLPLWAMKLISDADNKSYALSFYTSLSPERQLALDRVFCDEYLLPRLFPMGRATLEAKKQEGYHVILLSASTENYMQHVAKALQVDGLICTKLDAQARVTENCKGEMKVQLLKRYLKEKEMEADFDASCAYGDSKSDLCIMNLVGNPIIVNGKKKLIHAAPHFPRVCWKNTK
ncbi:MAG: HAD-IB family hydrolase [Clostridia bacterium]|nr:HAD-IB family hydrolase [Clostridia bacterium]MBR6809068.1 HAD-IB family hydrolase [Clostridia bacterium]